MTIARQFYKHALKTLAMVVGAFGTAGAIGYYVTFSAGEYHPAYSTVVFLAWGCVGAALTLWLRKPPF